MIVVANLSKICKLMAFVVVTLCFDQSQHYQCCRRSAPTNTKIIVLKHLARKVYIRIKLWSWFFVFKYSNGIFENFQLNKNYKNFKYLILLIRNFFFYNRFLIHSRQKSEIWTEINLFFVKDQNLIFWFRRILQNWTVFKTILLV